MRLEANRHPTRHTGSTVSLYYAAVAGRLAIVPGIGDQCSLVNLCGAFN